LRKAPTWFFTATAGTGSEKLGSGHARLLKSISTRPVVEKIEQTPRWPWLFTGVIMDTML